MGKLVSNRFTSNLGPPPTSCPPNPELPLASFPKWLGGGRAEELEKGSIDERFAGGGDVGTGDREEERLGGGERVRSCSGAVS